MPGRSPSSSLMVRDWRYQSSVHEPPPVLGGHAELVVDDGNAGMGPVGFGLVLQVGQDLPVGLPGLVQFPGAPLQVGLAEGGVQP